MPPIVEAKNPKNYGQINRTANVAVDNISALGYAVENDDHISFGKSFVADTYGLGQGIGNARQYLDYNNNLIGSQLTGLMQR